MGSLSSKTILITGASRGIGAAIAQTCAQQGARVLMHYGSRRETAAQLARQIDQSEDDLLKADLTQPQAGDQLWSMALARTSRVDAVVNNAGIYEPASLDVDDEIWQVHWQRTWAVNVQACADLSRAAVRHFRSVGGGALVNIASRAAHRGDGPEYLAYAASKGAMVAMTKTLARGFGAEGLRAYTVCPGWVATEMAPQDPHEIAKVAAEIPWGQMAQPAEIGALVAFLISDVCPSATGATFDVNGASYVR